MKKILRNTVALLSTSLVCTLGGPTAFAEEPQNYSAEISRYLAQLGLVERQAVLPDNALLNYGEGPDNGPVLLLLHGQMDSWESYHPVLAELSREFHVFAVDCHGHGKSQKDPAKYSALRMGEDLHWFIQNIIKEPVIISGHSSGGLLSVWIAATYPEDVLGLVIEDAPFFSTEPERCPHTVAWVGQWQSIHDFLNQDEYTNYFRYFLDHSFMAEALGPVWEMIRTHALNALEANPGQKVEIPGMPEVLSGMFSLLQGPYDPRFGETFYDCSWFDGFDQASVLARVKCPSTLIHTNWSYAPNGMLLAAMDGDDAQRAHELLPDNLLINVDSGHAVHQEKPAEFVRITIEFKNRIGL